MSEMIERIAQAALALDDTIWVGDNQMLYFRRVAVAALEAMREPTDEMIAVMAAYDWSRDRFVPPRLMRPFEDDAADCWREMIDEALK